VTPDPNDGTGVATTVPDLVAEANDAYVRGQEALARGDWAAYGEAQAELGRILDQLETLTGETAPTPSGAPVATPEP
jgi:hypothetical protein